MIRTTDLGKRYGALTAIKDLNLSIERGEIYGFLGPNGAGKTTTIKMLLGVVQPTSGEIYLFNERFSSSRLDLRRRIGVVPEKHPQGVWKWMTGYEYLAYFAELFEVKRPKARIRYLLDQVGIAEAGGRKVSTYSRGMTQKLSIVRALLHDPDLLFLDEPISGLDPLGIKQVRDLIEAENRDGRTIFISSHLLSEVEKICKRVAIIFRGKLMAEDTMGSLLSNVTSEQELRIELETTSDDIVKGLREIPFVRAVSGEGSVVTVRVPNDHDYRGEVSRFLMSQGVAPLGLELIAPSLEDAFVTITGENIEQLSGRNASHE